MSNSEIRLARMARIATPMVARACREGGNTRRSGMVGRIALLLDLLVGDFGVADDREKRVEMAHGVPVMDYRALKTKLRFWSWRV